MITKICETCNKEFPSTPNSKVKTCSKPCGIIYRSKKQKELHPHPLRTCEICGNLFPDKNYSKNRTCSPECAEILKQRTWIINYGVDNPAKVKRLQDKAKATNRIKRGVEYSTQDPDVIEKRKATNAAKSIEEINNTKLKRKNTSQKNWGVDNVFQNEEIKNISKATNRKNLGVDYPMQATSIQEKSVATFKEKYNVDNASQVPEFQKEKENTCIERFGETNPSKSAKGKQLIIAGNVKKYNAHSKTQADAYARVQHLSDPDSVIIDLYVNQHIPITKIAQMYGTGETFITTILNNHNISITRFESMGEREIAEYIISIGFTISKDNRNNRKILLCGKEIDIFIPDKLIGIEYNGIYFHSEQILLSRHTIDPKKYHLLKTIEAEKKGIQLIHIFEDDWLYRKNIVKSRLSQILGVAEKGYYARKCTVVVLSYSETEQFLNTYHIQGNSTSSSVNLGLLNGNNQLVACMTFCKLRGGVIGKELPKDGEYELLRFCSSGRITGGASKLFSYFIQTYSPVKIVSYADRHWTSTIKPNLYDILGFKKVSDGKPNYWYIIKDKREHRFNWRKSVLFKKLSKFNPSLTEYENMLANGYDRIWGCGSLKYEYLAV